MVYYKINIGTYIKKLNGVSNIMRKKIIAFMFLAFIFAAMVTAANLSVFADAENISDGESENTSENAEETTAAPANSGVSDGDMIFWIWIALAAIAVIVVISIAVSKKRTPVDEQ
jgi:beta-lactamase regulating signal transducer with metallopeptidase domain